MDAEVVAGAVKVDSRLLLVRSYLQQDHFFRGAVAEDRFAEEVEVGFPVETVEELAIIRGNIEMVAEYFGIIDLEAVETGEALHLDQLGLKAAFAVFAADSATVFSAASEAVTKWPLLI